MKEKGGCFGSGYKLSVIMFDNGDRSVGIEPTQVEITFKANVEFKDQIDYKAKDAMFRENRELFREDVRKLSQWFTDMPVQVYLEDECVDCGQVVKDKRKHYKECPIHALER